MPVGKIKTLDPLQLNKRILTRSLLRDFNCSSGFSILSDPKKSLLKEITLRTGLMVL